MSNRKINGHGIPHIPTFGELLGHVAKVCRLREHAVREPDYRLKRCGSTWKYAVRGCATPRVEQEFIDDFAKALIASDLLPGLRQCIRLGVPAGQDIPPEGVEQDAQTTVDWTVHWIRALEDRWNKVVFGLRSQRAAAARAPQNLVAEIYLRLLVAEVALRFASLIRLGHLKRPGPSRISTCCRMEGPTVFKEILDSCDPAKVRSSRPGEPLTALDRQALIRLGSDDRDPELHVPQENSLPGGRAIDRLLTERDYVPNDETIRRVAERLQPAFRGDEDLLRLLRRRYAIVSAAKQVRKLVGDQALGHLAEALEVLVNVLLNPRLDPPEGPSRDRWLAILALLGAASPAGKHCLRSLRSRPDGFVDPDLLALVSGQEGRRIAECTWIVSQWVPGPGQSEADFHGWLRAMQWQGREELKASVASAPWPDETSREVARQGLLYIVALREEQWEEAEGHLAAGLAAHPGNLTLRHWRFRLRLSRRDYDGAGADAKAIRAGDPENTAVYLSLAETLVREGAPRAALECLDCVRGPDEITEVYMAHWRGLAHLQLQDFRKALDEFRIVLDCQKDHPEAHAYAADCYYRLDEPRKGAEKESEAQNLGASELLDALRCNRAACGRIPGRPRQHRT